jgi:hypothetical protein
MNRLAEAHRALTRAFVLDRELNVRLLPEDQLLISKNLVANPDDAGHKTPPMVPGRKGYTIYVKCSVARASPGPQQRTSVPVDAVQMGSAAPTLRLDRHSLEQRWELLNAEGARLSITARCGSVAVFDEVDGVLAVVASVLGNSGLHQNLYRGPSSCGS